MRKYREEGIIQYNSSHPTALNLLADSSDIMKEIVSLFARKQLASVTFRAFIKVRLRRRNALTTESFSHEMRSRVRISDLSFVEVVSTAVNKAIGECIDEDVLRDFFIEYREEVSKVAILEYSAEKHLQYEKEDSYNSGYDTGYGTGHKSGHTSGIKDTTDLFSWLKKNNRESDILKAIDDPDYLEKLFDAFSKAIQS